MRFYLFGLPVSLAAATHSEVLEIEELPSLYHAVSNNAVTLVSTGQGVDLCSFLGLWSGKTWQDITSVATISGGTPLSHGGNR